MMSSKSQVEDTIVQHKVDASKYFLTKMREVEWGDPAFRYNVEAFIAILHSARSVIYDFDKSWFLCQKITSDPLAVYFLELRNVTIHRYSPNPKQIVQVTLTISSGYCIKGEEPQSVSNPGPAQSSKSFYIFEPLDDEIKGRIGGKTDHAVIDKILRETDVITLCEEYLQMILTIWKDYQTHRDN